MEYMFNVMFIALPITGVLVLAACWLSKTISEYEDDDINC